LFPSIVEDDSGDIILGSELDLADEEVLGPAVVYDTTSNTATIDEDPIRVPLGPAVEDIVGEFNGTDAVVDLPSNGPSIPSFTRKITLLLAHTGRRQPESQRCGGINEDLAIGDIAPSMSETRKNSIRPWRGNWPRMRMRT